MAKPEAQIVQKKTNWDLDTNYADIICYSGLRRGIWCDIPSLEFIFPEPNAETWIIYVTDYPCLNALSSTRYLLNIYHVVNILSAYVKDFVI